MATIKAQVEEVLSLLKIKIDCRETTRESRKFWTKSFPAKHRELIGKILSSVFEMHKEKGYGKFAENYHEYVAREFYFQFQTVNSDAFISGTEKKLILFFNFHKK